MRFVPCKKCGHSIVFIRTIKGKSMPCEAEPQLYIAKRGGRRRIITLNGETLACEYTDDLSKATGYGYIPHFQICKGRE